MSSNPTDHLSVGDIVERYVPGTGRKRTELLEIVSLSTSIIGGEHMVLVEGESGLVYDLHPLWLAPQHLKGGGVMDTIRRDALRMGDVFRSSHGYDFCITEIQDNALVRTDERHIGFIGDMHRWGGPRVSERYSASSEVEIVTLKVDA